jgi:YVTN family beta-propeller protein
MRRRRHAILAFFCTGLVAASCTRDGKPAERDAAAPAIAGSYGIYVTNEASGDLTVIDAATHTAVATVPLGKRPRGIRVSPDRSVLYVALSGSPIAPPGTDESKLPPPDRSADGIGVFDVGARTLRTILRGPSDPEQTAVSRDGRYLYIANEDTGEASVLEVSTAKTVATFEVGGEPEGVTASPDGRFVYVTSEEDNRVSVIETATNRLLSQFEVGARPRDSAFLPDSSKAYVTAENGGTISVVDVSAHAVIDTIQLTGPNVRPMGIVASADGKRLYVSTGRGGTVVSVDTATNRPVGSVAVGTRPWGLALSPDGTRLYTANGPSNDVTVVDTSSFTVVTRVPAGRSPWGVAVVPR